MRRFEDSMGRSWDVILGRESWGAYYALFVPEVGGGDIRRAMLSPDGQDEATRELLELDQAQLSELFLRSEPAADGG